MKSIHSVHGSDSLARRAGLITTIGLALAASVVPLAAQSTDAAMAVALKDTDGTKGWLLKRGTSMRASQDGDYVFEPASTIKFLHHLHAELMIQNNWVSPQQPITGTNLYN